MRWPWPDVRWNITYGEPHPCTPQSHRDYCEFCTDRAHWAPSRRTDPAYPTTDPVPCHRSWATAVEIVELVGPRHVRWRGWSGEVRDATNVDVLRVYRGKGSTSNPQRVVSP